MQYLQYLITIACTVIPLLIAHIVSHSKTSQRCDMNEKRIESHEQICREDKYQMRQEIKKDTDRIYDKIEDLAKVVRGGA